MAESATKVIEPPKTYNIEDRIISDITVEGFDDPCLLQNYALGLALIKHFGSCGNILAVDFIKSVAFIRLEGEGAQEKALLLDGTDVGGWKAIVKAAVRPLVFNYPRDPNASIKSSVVFVKGYDTGLAEIDIMIALCNHFSSCGEITEVAVIPGKSAIIYIRGEGCLEKALELNGSVMEGMNLVVDSGKRQTPVPENRRLLNDNACGYVLGSYPRLRAKRRKEERKKEREMKREVKMKVMMEKKKEREMKREVKRKVMMEKKKKREMKREMKMKVNDKENEKGNENENEIKNKKKALF